MPKRKLTALGAIPIDPNESGPDPQFGDLSELPKGVKRQTAIIKLTQVQLTDPKNWARIVFSFPECLGIKETLDNAAKSTSCIPSVSMDVPINLPVIKNVQIDEIHVSRKYGENTTLTDTDNLSNNVFSQNRAYILTGEDQLTNKAPSIDDETTKIDVSTYSQYAALSDTIYAKFYSMPEPKLDNKYSSVVKPADFKGTGWLYGKSVSGVQGIDYKDVALRFLQPSLGPNEDGTCFEVNNIMSKGHLLLKDHVNLFVQTEVDSTGLEFRIMIDYTTRQVSLSSLLVWQQQLTEFLPKQVRWRVWNQQAEPDKNGWTILVSRGVAKENGKGNDPTDKTQFPDIKD